MKIEINITPMCMKNKVLGLPIACCRDWDASKSVPGKLNYAGRVSDITFSPKHVTMDINSMEETASAWQFSVNDSVQFAKLMMDGVYTYAEGRMSGEKLICEMVQENSGYTINVIEVRKQPETNATRKIKELLEQGIRPVSSESSKAPLWNSPSEWINIDQINNYKDVTDCLYLWHGRKPGNSTVYLYVGIVGDTRRGGKSRRNLSQRILEEQKKFRGEEGIEISAFRFCSLNNAQGFPVPELLKTVEMSEITVMSSLFKCERARDNIDPLFSDIDVVLLNKMTSYKYVT